MTNLNPQKHTFIYGLTDPNTGKIRYVGKARNPQQRLNSHMTGRGYTSGKKKVKWLDDLIANNQKPEVIILERCLLSEWREREKYWIAKIAAKGNKLLNGNMLARAIRLKLPSDVWGKIYLQSHNDNETIENTIIKLLNNCVDNQ